MAGNASLRPYLAAISQALQTALCIQTFPCQNVERHNKPEVELQDSPELLLPPVELRRSERESCLIEGSINSTRISFKLHHDDQLDAVLTRLYVGFIQQRAETLDILRRVPVPGYDVSFLITDQHLLRLHRQALMDFIVGFVEEMDAEISGLFKLTVNARGRQVAAEFLKGLCG